jgi:hypothetical protein
MCGAYTITLRTISNETGLSQEVAAALLNTFASGEGPRVVWWPDEHFVFVRNMYRHQRVNSSDKYRIGAAKQAVELPDVVRETVWIAYPELRPSEIPHLYPIDRVSIDQNKSKQIKDKAETKQEEKPAARATRLPDPFVVDESMDEWAFDKGMSDEFVAKHTEAFVLTFKANGHTMKNWRARWQKWMLDAQENGGQYQKRA